jgi:hypothetical protein
MMETEFVFELSLYSSEITLQLAWEDIKCHRHMASKYVVDCFMVSEESSWIGLDPSFW